MVEVRTFASSSTASRDGGGASSSNSPPEHTYAEGHGRRSRNGNDEHGDCTDAGTGTADIDDGGVPLAGKRVRLVCLLGDLDLEVEFCAPHSPLPKQGGAKLPSDDRAEGHQRSPEAHSAGDIGRNPGAGQESRSSKGDLSPSPNAALSSACSTAGLQAAQPSSAFDSAAGRIGGQSEQLGRSWTLPAPARARRSRGGDDSVSGPGPETPRRRIGEKAEVPRADESYKQGTWECFDRNVLIA